MERSQTISAEAARARGLGLGSRLRPLLPYLYLAPALIVIGLFVFYPLGRAFFNSFWEGNLLNPYRRYVGLEHYTDLLTDARFHDVLLQSGAYLLFALLGSFLLPIGLALLTLQLTEREVDLFQSVFFLPTVVATNIAVIVWSWFYLPAGGLFNTVLGAFGLESVQWLKDDSIALPAVALVANWKHFGFHYLIALAGLKAIPRDYLEAAVVDGAAGLTMVRRIILPLFTPTALFLFVITLIQGLDHVFVPIEILTSGGPANATNNLMYAIYLEGFQFFRIGQASALSIVLIVLLGGLIYWQFRLLERTVHYER